MTDFNWFADDGVFMPMLNDTARNRFYKQAIESVAQGRTVVDIGAGTGMLSILASRAGARRVIAVEKDPGRAQFVQEMISKVGLKNIEVVNADFLDTDIAGDVYVTETINTQIFGEGILDLARHARKHPGLFVPGQFEISATVYEDHPIFVLGRQRSEAFEFQPDIDIDPIYQEVVNKTFQATHPLDQTLYRANQLNNLFEMLPEMPEIKLKKFYETDTLIVDLNADVDINSLRLCVPADSIPPGSDASTVLFWKIKFGEITMCGNDAWFGNVEKVMLAHCRSGQDIVTWYDPLIKDWRFRF